MTEHTFTITVVCTTECPDKVTAWLQAICRTGVGPHIRDGIEYNVSDALVRSVTHGGAGLE